MKIGCGEGIRTPDLKVMSLASYQAAPPRDTAGTICRSRNPVKTFLSKVVQAPQGHQLTYRLPLREPRSPWASLAALR
jgi:hypothetical protein